MEGLSTHDAVAQQCALHEASHSSHLLLIDTPANSNPLIKIDSDGTVWIGGVKYQPASLPKPTKVSIAEVDVEAAMTAANHGEYADWALTNCDLNWTRDGTFNTATFLLAATNNSLPDDNNPPLYLDSGASTHISCIHSDFSEFKLIQLQTIMDVGKSSVVATGMGTIEFLIMRHLRILPCAMSFMRKKLVYISSLSAN